MTDKSIRANAPARLTVFALILAGSFVLGTHTLAAGHELEVFALFLARTASVYGGATLNPAATQYAAVELPVVIMIFAVAIVGLLASPVWVAIGYFGHGG